MFWRIKLIIKILRTPSTEKGTLIQGFVVPAVAQKPKRTSNTPNMVFMPSALNMFSASEIKAIMEGTALPLPGTYRVEE